MNWTDANISRPSIWKRQPILIWYPHRSLVPILTSARDLSRRMKIERDSKIVWTDKTAWASVRIPVNCKPITHSLYQLSDHPDTMYNTWGYSIWYDRANKVEIAVFSSDEEYLAATLEKPEIFQVP